MKAIKDQISAIVVFNATTLPNLTKEYDEIRDRLLEGLDKMKVANVFSKNEIEEIRVCMYEVLNNRYTSVRTDIINKLRSEFIF
jgi:flagellar basal body-associated protein FliL